MPPAGLEELGPQGIIEPHRRDEAILVWGQTRAALAANAVDLAAAERLLWLVRLFRNTVAVGQGDATALRGRLEASLEVLALPRHRDLVRCFPAREAIKAGDLHEAEAWLSGCDPRSEDLSMDSEYRVTAAMVALGQQYFGLALQLLGNDEKEVPVQDALDPMATVLRAHAHERLGNLSRAVELLERFMQMGASSAIERNIAALPARWNACAQSLPRARGAVREAIGERAGGAGSILLGIIVFSVGSLPLATFVWGTVVDGFVPESLLALIFPVIFGTMGLTMLLQGLRQRRIAAQGISARGKVVDVRLTGTEINNVPKCAVVIDVTAPGHPPARATAYKVAHPGQLQPLVGREIDVLWDPSLPHDVVANLRRSSPCLRSPIASLMPLAAASAAARRDRPSPSTSRSSRWWLGEPLATGGGWSNPAWRRRDKSGRGRRSSGQRARREPRSLLRSSRSRPGSADASKPPSEPTRTCST